MAAVLADRPQTLEQLSDIVTRALAAAKQGGATAADAGVSIDAGLSVTVRLGEVETLEYQSDRGMGITVYCGQRKGSASTADLSWPSVSQTVAKALSIARFTTDDPHAGLPDAKYLAKEVPDLELSHPWSLEPEAAIELARQCERAALDVDPRITNSEGGSVSTHRALRVYGNTHGFVAGYPSTVHSVSCAVVAQQGDDMQREYWYSTTRDPAALEAADAIGARAARRALDRLGAVKLSTRKAPVLFVPELARGLVGHFLGAISGGAQYRRSSFLLDAAGQRIFPAWMQMLEQPHLKRALGSSPFDAEGVATRDRQLVHDGVIDGYLLDAYAARKLGLEPTGNAGGVHTLTVTPTAGDFDALLRQMGTGMVVTELLGQGVNAVTGDYSRGAAGFWVENGAIAYPVHEVTIAGNLREVYRDLVAVGSDVDARGRVRCGSILAAEMTIAGD